MTFRVAAVAAGRVFNRSSTSGGPPPVEPPPTTGQARTRLGVYPRFTAGGGRAYLLQFESWLNRTMYGVTQFGAGAPNDSHAVWASANPASAESFTGAYKRTTIAETLGLASPALDGSPATALTSEGRDKITANLQRSIAGELDADVQQTCDHLLAGGYTAPLIRIGWEANGHWYPWSVYGSATNQALYAQAFRRLALLIKGRIPGAKIDWNGVYLGAWDDTWDDFEACYPGDDVVDIVSVDFYDMDVPAARSGNQWADPADVLATYFEPVATAWKAFVYGRDATRAAAGLAPLQFGMPEWGPSGKEASGGGDNPAYIQWIYDLQQSFGTRFEYGAPFDTDDYDEEHALMPPGGVGTNPNFPNASALFKTLYGNPGTGGGGAIATADPQLIAEGVAQLKWMRSLRGTGKYFSGQAAIVRHFTVGAGNFDTIAANSGARPLFGIIDPCHWGTSSPGPTPANMFDGTQSLLWGKAHAAAGGLLEMNVHAGNPINGLSGDANSGSMPSNFDVGQMVINGTSQNAALVANYLTPLRTILLSFQADRIPIWLRLFHEWNFWWSQNFGISKANLRALWMYCYQWLWANGVHNVITVYGPKGEAGVFDDDWRPPWSMIDAVGVSIYDQPSSSFDYPFYDTIAAQDKPMFAGEFGPATYSPSFQAVPGYNAVTGLLAAHADEPDWVGDIWWWDAFGIQNSAGGGVGYMQHASVINLGESTWRDFLV
ncbi:MAG: glycosyl hydrolase [Acidimicrobiia bacterium]